MGRVSLQTKFFLISCGFLKMWQNSIMALSLRRFGTNWLPGSAPHGLSMNLAEATHVKPFLNKRDHHSLLFIYLLKQM